MKSAKCANCGFVGWADEELCKRCGASMSTTVAEETASASVSFSPSYSGYAVTSGAELKKGLAVASLVIGILNFLLFGIFVVPLIVGIVVSVVALNRIKRYPNEYGGKSLAIGGLVTNIVCGVLLVPVMIIAAIAIPNLLGARRAANESQVMRSLLAIHSAEQNYQEREGRGEYGSLSDLEKVNLIYSAETTKWGYRFKLETFKPSGYSSARYTAVATPTQYGSSGRRSFFIDETGVLRGEDSHGLEANSSSPPLADERDYPEIRSGSRRSNSYPNVE